MDTLENPVLYLLRAVFSAQHYFMFARESRLVSTYYTESSVDSRVEDVKLDGKIYGNSVYLSISRHIEK